MYNAVMQYAPESRLIIKAAAVSDYYVPNPNRQKVKKKDGLTLDLKKTRDILLELGQKKTNKQFIVGFAAESQDVEAYAKQKLKTKNLDLIVGNNILQKDAGFDVDTNRVMLVDGDKTTELPLMSKEEVAERIVDTILSHKRWNQTA
jgi:phosphopantothenoylcysteine decarboxylase/phosphopantothenate--cysteine ligase